MFDIKGSKILLNTDDLAIPPFKDHYNNAKDKAQALKEIEYVIWLYKWNTPYEAYSEKERALFLYAKNQGNHFRVCNSPPRFHLRSRTSFGFLLK